MNQSSSWSNCCADNDDMIVLVNEIHEVEGIQLKYTCSEPSSTMNLLMCLQLHVAQTPLLLYV